jgi:hypothetical protein
MNNEEAETRVQNSVYQNRARDEGGASQVSVRTARELGHTANMGRGRSVRTTLAVEGPSGQVKRGVSQVTVGVGLGKPFLGNFG